VDNKDERAVGVMGRSKVRRDDAKSHRKTELTARRSKERTLDRKEGMSKVGCGASD
jgi:hypothetical protein